MNYADLASGTKLPVVGLGTWQYRGGLEPLVEHIRENCAASDFQLSPEELSLLDRNVEYVRR